MDADRRRFITRGRVVLVTMLVGLGGVAVRAAHLQIGKHEDLARLAFSQYLNDVKIPAKRGHIYDRNGKPMAISVEVPSVYANPMAIADPRVASRRLAEVLGMKVETIYQRLASERLFVWLKRQVDPEVAEAVRKLDLEGIAITQESRRFYPNKEIGAHVLGFTGVDVEGLEGVERALDERLAGEPQVIPTLRDARGHSVLHGELDPEHRARGSDVWLTVDLAVQHAAEGALQAVVKETNAAAAVAVVLEVGTANILAAAIKPDFNPNEAMGVAPAARRARVFTDFFEPGSTFKPLVVAIALETGVIDADTKLFCENGTYKVDNHTIHDGVAAGWRNLSDIIAHSSNIGMAKIGQALGKKRLYEHLRELGFGERTGVDFPGESPGMLRNPSTWSELGLCTISFGQGVAVTALQLAAAYHVLASGGLYRAPRLVSRVESPLGRAGHIRDPEARRVLSPRVVQNVTQMLEAAVTPEGTAWRGAITGYRVAGKTGTAQKIDPVAGGYSRDKFIASYAGYLPADDPRVVIVVAVDEPQGAHSGAVVAAPVFAQIASATMRHLGVVPSTTTLSEALQRARQDAERREEELAARGHADEPVPVSSIPHTPGTVPSFLGLTAREVMERYEGSELNIDLELLGSGRVVKQDPPAGSKVVEPKVVLTMANP